MFTFTLIRCIEKEIGVDTARYYLQVDDREDILHTGGDGYWGSYEELSRNTRDGRMVEAAILTVIWPEYESMESMRQHAFFFFRDMQLLSEEMEEADNEPQIYGEEGIGI